MKEAQQARLTPERGGRRSGSGRDCGGGGAAAFPRCAARRWAGSGAPAAAPSAAGAAPSRLEG